MKTITKEYVVDHFTHLADGAYSNGIAVNVQIDLSSIAGLPSEYYVETYLEDATTKERLNQESYYTVVNGNVTQGN